MHIPTLFSQIKVTIDLCSIVKNILPAPFTEHLSTGSSRHMFLAKFLVSSDLIGRLDLRTFGPLIPLGGSTGI